MSWKPTTQASWLTPNLHIRWALLAGVLILTYDKLGNPFIGALTGMLFASNIGFAIYLRSSKGDLDGARLFAACLRIADGVGVTIFSLAPTLAGERLWLLGIPIILAEALSSRNRSSAAMLVGLMTAVQVVAFLTGALPLKDLAISVALFGILGGIGLLLAGYKSQEDRLHSRDRRLSAVLDCGTAFAATRSLKATVVHTLKTAVNEVGASCGYVLLLDDEGKGPLVAEAAYGVDGEFEFPETLDVGFGLSGFVARTGQPVSVSDDSIEHQSYDGVMTGIHAAISVPLVTRATSTASRGSDEQVLGVITMLSRTRGHQFSGDDMDLLRTLSALIAVAVANARMEERRHETFVRTLESLATALEARDEYTQGHSQRVCDVSMLLGERMGLSPEAMEELRIGTVLHDIGKIGVPDAILNKRARLTDEEFALMKLHPVIGYEICKPLMLSEGILMIIRNHHEKLDGSGYPDGLKGGELPLSLRIVCIADAFDAMSSTRPYRGEMALSDVLAELSRGAGTQFDPVVVEALKHVLPSDRFQSIYLKEAPVQERRAA
ncbi:MAG: HD domain-containing protein [Armatimonadetes bacterium]|nr:HD domain-containing protein [Armatimonadota bacterium]